MEGGLSFNFLSPDISSLHNFNLPGVFAIYDSYTGEYYIGSTSNIAATVWTMLKGLSWCYLINHMTISLKHSSNLSFYNFRLLAVTSSREEANRLCQSLVNEFNPTLNRENNNTYTTTICNPMGMRYSVTVSKVPSGVRSMHSSARTNRTIDTTFLKEVVNPAMEVDYGQETDNVHILAKRFMDSGQKPTANIINTVLKYQGDNRISEEHINMFYDLYNKRVHIDSLPIDHEVMNEKVRSHMENNEDAAGTYIFTHNDTGKQYVGSSRKLIWRTKSHYTYQSRDCGIAKRIKVDGRESYTLDYLIIPREHQSVSMTLALEQFLFFLLKPTINILIIANSTLKEYTEEELTAMRKITGKTVYTYYKDVLVHMFESRYHCTETLIGNKRSQVVKQAINKYDGRYYTDLQFSMEPLENKEVNLVSLEEVRVIFKTVQENNKIN